ncbi:LysR family transcriptional regulator [Xenophilus aerolatus]
MNFERYARSSLKTRHLKLIDALSRHGSIGAVAKVMFITQPAVSKALAELEEGIGARLFCRTASGVVPTPAGACLVSYARRILGEIDRAGDALAAISDGVSETVVVGVMPGPARSMMAQCLARVHSSAPHIRLVVREAPMPALLSLLQQGKIDLAIGSVMDGSPPSHIWVERLYEDTIAVCASTTFKPARKRAELWARLSATDWVLPPRQNLLRSTFDDYLERRSLGPFRAIVETASVDVTTGLLGASTAATVVPRRLAEHCQRAGLLQILFELEDVGMPVSVCASREPGAAASIVVDAAKSATGGTMPGIRAGSKRGRQADGSGR